MPTRRPWTEFPVTSDRFRRQPGRSRAHTKPCFLPTLKTHRDSASFYSRAPPNGTAHHKVYPDKAMVADVHTESLPRPQHVVLAEMMDVYESHQQGKRSDPTMRGGVRKLIALSCLAEQGRNWHIVVGSWGA